MGSRARRALLVLVLALAGAAAVPLAAQAPGVAAICEGAVPLIADPVAYPRNCYSTAQALLSLHPQLGMLAAAGNPVLGSASPAALRVGRRARVDATLRLDLAGMQVPGILAMRGGSGGSGQVTEEIAFTARAIRGGASVGLYPGRTLSPRAVGVGSVDLLGSAAWLPLRSSRVRGFRSNAAAGGLGARLGVVREGFGTPGVSLTVMHLWTSEVDFGNVCPTAPASTPPQSCSGIGNTGELTLDASGWSARAIAGRRLGGIGALAGVGYDRFGGSGSYTVRVPSGVAGPPDGLYSSGPHGLREPRWSAFVGASQTRLLTTFAVELGWMQGGSPLAGYEQLGAEHDPRRGTFFGSVGGRLAF